MSSHRALLLVLLVIGLALVGARLTQPEPVATHTNASTKILCRQLPTRERFERTDLIVTGSVFAVVPNVDGSADVLITPSQILKGIPPEAGIVLAATPTVAGGGRNSQGDLHFTSNDQPYLLMLHGRDDGRYNTSTCDGSRLLGDGLTAQEQDALRQ